MGNTVQGPTMYEIRVWGLLDRRWWGWFDGYTIVHERSDETILIAQVSDQRLLIGTLVTLDQLGHPLVSMTRRPT